MAKTVELFVVKRQTGRTRNARDAVVRCRGACCRFELQVVCSFLWQSAVVSRRIRPSEPFVGTTWLLVTLETTLQKRQRPCLMPCLVLVVRHFHVDTPWLAVQRSRCRHRH